MQAVRVCVGSHAPRLARGPPGEGRGASCMARLKRDSSTQEKSSSGPTRRDQRTTKSSKGVLNENVFYNALI